MKKIIIILSSLIMTVLSANAQTITSIQYTLGIPTGALADHTGNVSGRGVTFELHRQVTEAVTIGTNLGYSCFYEKKDYGSYTDGTATLTGIQYRYNNLFPMLINAHYYLGKGPIRPYIGLGAGTIYDLRNTDMGMYTIEEDNWHFLMSPEAGVNVMFGDGVGIKFNVKYDNAFKIENADAFGNLTLNLGFVFDGE